MRVGRGDLAPRGCLDPAGISVPQITLLDSVHSMSIFAVSIPVQYNVLFSYSGFAREKENRFHTASPADKSHECLGVIWSGVISHHSEYDDFRDGRKCARPVMRESKEDLLRRTHEEDVRAFGVRSSCSLSGRIWAQSVTSAGTGRR